MKFLKYLTILISLGFASYCLFISIELWGKTNWWAPTGLLTLSLINAFVLYKLHVHPPAETEGEPSLLTLWYTRIKMEQAAKIQNLSEQLDKDSDKPT